jgi:hypothetical protein
MSAVSSPLTELKSQGLKKKYPLKVQKPKTTPLEPSPRLLKVAPHGEEPWPGFFGTDLLDMARIVTRYIHFLDPAVIAAVVQDNRGNAASWKRALERAGVKPDLYLWEGSPCCFPGIRRYEGATEKQGYTKKLANRRFPNALELDFNEYPKRIWEHVMGEIPQRFSLMHLISFRDAPPGSGHNAFLPVKGIHGLFTSAANMAAVPNSLVTIISINDPLRSLLIQRLQRLYGSVCALVPAEVQLPRVKDDQDWDYDSFDWAPCSGAADMQPFLRSRNLKMEELLGL